MKIQNCKRRVVKQSPLLLWEPREFIEDAQNFRKRNFLLEKYCNTCTVDDALIVLRYGILSRDLR